jgi:hypothetical protein
MITGHLEKRLKKTRPGVIQSQPDDFRGEVGLRRF